MSFTNPSQIMHMLGEYKVSVLETERCECEESSGLYEYYRWRLNAEEAEKIREQLADFENALIRPVNGSRQPVTVETYELTVKYCLRPGSTEERQNIHAMYNSRGEAIANRY